MAETTIRTTCPRDCYDACGVLVTLTDGAIKNVRGDVDHPISRGKLCRKCTIGYNGAFLDPDQRLTAPLRRVGPKGSGRFEPISWDAAIAEISERRSGESSVTTAPTRDPERALHRHLLAAGRALPDAVLQPAGRHRGGSRIRSATRRGRSPSTTSLAARSRGLTLARWPTAAASWCGAPTPRRRPAPARALAGRGGRRVIVVDPCGPIRRRRRRSISSRFRAPTPRSPSRWCTCSAVTAWWIRASSPPIRWGTSGSIRWSLTAPRSGGKRSPACRRKLIVRAAHRTAPARRCCGSVRGSSASRPAATSCVRARCCRR